MQQFHVGFLQTSTKQRVRWVGLGARRASLVDEEEHSSFASVNPPESQNRQGLQNGHEHEVLRQAARVYLPLSLKVDFPRCDNRKITFLLKGPSISKRPTNSITTCSNLQSEAAQGLYNRILVMGDVPHLVSGAGWCHHQGFLLVGWEKQSGWTLPCLAT